MDLFGRLRSDRVMQLLAPPRSPETGVGAAGTAGNCSGDLASLQLTISTLTFRYSRAAAAAWNRVHPRLTLRAAWLDHDDALLVIEGTRPSRNRDKSTLSVKQKSSWRDCAAEPDLARLAGRPVDQPGGRSWT